MENISKNQPLVSVIMPVYNAGLYIGEAIQSLIDQTYFHWELLVINDGSQDNSVDIIHSFHDKRIRYFFQKNAGVCAARNVGLLNMQGKYHCFLDADDLFPPESLAVRVAYMEQFSETNLLDSGVEVRSLDLKKLIRKFCPVYKGNVKHLYIRLSPDIFFSLNPFLRSSICKNIFFKEGMTHCEDLMYYTDILWQSNTLYDSIQDVCYHYRQAEGTAMSNLKGLEKGYFSYYHSVAKLNGIQSSQLLYLKKRIIRIIFLSYLVKKQFKNAFRILLWFIR